MLLSFLLSQFSFVWSAAYPLVVERDIYIAIPREAAKWFEYGRFTLEGQPPPVKFTIRADFNAINWNVTLALKPSNYEVIKLRSGAAGVLVRNPGSVSLAALKGTNCSELQGNYQVSAETASGVSLSKRYFIGKRQMIIIIPETLKI